MIDCVFKFKNILSSDRYRLEGSFDNKIVCAYCGSVNAISDDFCCKCGVSLTHKPQLRNQRRASKEIAPANEPKIDIVAHQQDEQKALLVFLANDKLYNLWISHHQTIRLGNRGDYDLNSDSLKGKTVLLHWEENFFSVRTIGFSQDVNVHVGCDEMVLLGTEERALIYITKKIGIAHKALALPYNCTFTFGRTIDNDVAISLPFVSGRHFVLKRNGETITVQDANSKNGLFLNGHRINSARLKNGDVLEILSVKMRIENATISFENVGYDLVITNQKNEITIV